MKASLLLVLVIACGVHAGEVLRAECADCGYTERDLWVGRGIEDPFGRFALYVAADWGRVVSVQFDLSFEFGEMIGYDFQPIRRDTAIWKVLEEHSEAYQRYRDDWEPPKRLVLCDLPPGVRLYSIATICEPAHGYVPTPTVLELFEGFRDADVVTCPRCGAEALSFDRSAYWD